MSLQQNGFQTSKCHSSDTSTRKSADCKRASAKSTDAPQHARRTQSGRAYETSFFVHEIAQDIAKPGFWVRKAKAAEDETE
jgi:hypothetical protein